MFKKNYATVKTSDPATVRAECEALGQEYHNGAIFVECPEMGMVGANLLYCRYGLSIPYLTVQVGWKVWIQPTYGDSERWIYTGIADAGVETVDGSLQLAITVAAGLIYMTINDTIHISDEAADEPFILGNKFKTWVDNFVTSVYNAHTHTSAAPGSPTGPPLALGTNPADIYSEKIFGE